MRRRWNRGFSSSAEDSFGVLLQLILPVTLILAFVVVTELRQFKNLYDGTINTPPGQAIQQAEEAILTLQEQLLLKAVRDVFEAQATELDLPGYFARIPTPDQVVDHVLSTEFTSTTRILYDRLGTRTRRSATQARMRELAIGRFKELAEQEIASHPTMGEKLRQISSVNVPKFDRAISGEMDDLFRKASEPQYDLIVRWLRSPRTTDASGEEIRKAWEAFVSAEPADRKSRSDRFVNLKILALEEILDHSKAPLLEEAVHALL